MNKKPSDEATPSKCLTFHCDDCVCKEQLAEKDRRIKELEMLNDEQYQSFQKWKKDYFTEVKDYQEALEKIEDHHKPSAKIARDVLNKHKGDSNG